MVVLWYQDWTYNSLKQQLVRQGHGLESEIVRDDVGFYVIITVVSSMDSSRFLIPRNQRILNTTSFDPVRRRSASTAPFFK